MMEGGDLFQRVQHIEFYVGSAREWAFYHSKALGFAIKGYAGPETGVRDRVSYLLEQGKVRLILTGFLDSNSDIGQHVRLHGDGVHDIALKVKDYEETSSFINERKVALIKDEGEIKTGEGLIRKGYVETYGETKHSLIDLSEYEGYLPPGFMEIKSADGEGFVGNIDHVVGNVKEGEMNSWVDFYIQGMGFTQLMSFDDKDISTKYSALRSKVVQYGKRNVVFPINEPALGLKKSQIQEYIDYYRSDGVQHIALHTSDIVKTVRELKARGVEFLNTSGIYYDTLAERVGRIDEDISDLRELGILVDRDDDGYLLQIFTKPIGDRPTFFYEIIQRKGATSFGKGNFKALFESIEREQERRGNL